MMWVSRYDSWGQANSPSHGRLLNVLKINSSLSKTPQLCRAFSHWKEVNLLCQTLETKRYVRTTAPCGSSCKGHTYYSKEGLMKKAQMERENVLSGGQNFNSELQISTNYYKTLLSFNFLVSPVLQCRVTLNFNQLKS